jgi:hypothetical protein
MVLFLPDPDDPPGRFLKEADKPDLPINWTSVVAGATEYFAGSSLAAPHSRAVAVGCGLYAIFAGWHSWQKYRPRLRYGLRS